MEHPNFYTPKQPKQYHILNPACRDFGIIKSQKKKKKRSQILIKQKFQLDQEFLVRHLSIEQNPLSYRFTKPLKLIKQIF